MPDVITIFDEVASKMLADLNQARAAVEHAGIKGQAIEETVREFLRLYLPGSLDISTGVLLDSTGATSRQLDVIISDSAKTPIFYRAGDHRVIPVECAYAVIEVKARLDSTNLDDCIKNMKSVRALKKTAFYPQSGDIKYSNTLYGRSWEYWPTNYSVFGFDSVDLGLLGERLLAKQASAKWPAHERIDMVCVLKRGVICNVVEGQGYDALPTPQSQLNVTKTSRALLLFYSLLSRYMNQARMPRFRFTDYLGHIEFGNEGDDT